MIIFMLKSLICSSFDRSRRMEVLRLLRRTDLYQSFTKSSCDLLRFNYSLLYGKSVSQSFFGQVILTETLLSKIIFQIISFNYYFKFFGNDAILLDAFSFNRCSTTCGSFSKSFGLTRYSFTPAFIPST